MTTDSLFNVSSDLVLITGACGQLGSEYAKTFLIRGAKVVGLIAGLIYLKDKVQIVADAFEYANKKLQQFLVFIGAVDSEEEKAADAAIELAKQKEYY